MQAPLLPFLQNKCGHIPKCLLLALKEKMACIALATIFLLLQKYKILDLQHLPLLSTKTTQGLQ